MAVELGDLVEDIVTGFQGVAIARELHLFRCDRVMVQPLADKKTNKLSESVYTFDAQSLKVVKKAYVKKEKTSEPQKEVGNAMSVRKRS